MNSSRNPGLSCPQCGHYIEVKITQLLDGSGVTCPSCQLHLAINSKPGGAAAFDKIRRMHDDETGHEPG